MSQETGSPKQSPVVDIRATTNSDADDNPVDSHFNYQEVTDSTKALENANRTSLSAYASAPDLGSFCRHDSGNQQKNENVSPGTGTLRNFETQILPRNNEDSTTSRIPRIAAPKQPANPSTGKSLRFGSSIPIAVHRSSAEQLSALPREAENENSPKGPRLLKKPRGPRPHPPTDQTPFRISESAEEMECAYPETSSSVSLSSSDTWDFKDIGDPERPPTVFTGEYRARVLGTPGNQTAGPTLRIASSAEEVIMGGAKQELSSSVVTQKSSPTFMQRLGKFTPSTPKNPRSPRGATTGSRGTQSSKTSVGSSKESTPISRNFYRPQISMESIPKRDISGKELSISRKPVNKSSLSSLFSPSTISLRSDEEPMVPKIPDQYISGHETSVRQVTNKSVELETPAKTAPETKGTPSSLEIKITPETAIKIGTIHPHPPRTSSLQALSEFPGVSRSEQSPTDAGNMSSKATNLRRNVTFNDITPLTSSDGQFNQSLDNRRLPESRSNHLLGSFRNIFKSRGGAVEKERAKNETEAPGTAKENKTPGSMKVTTKENMHHNDSEKSAKSKTKYATRLSSGVGWNRNGRNNRIRAESPTTPTPAIPRLLAPQDRSLDGNIPSFARSTTSTRTKATPAPKAALPGSVEVQTRSRPHVRTASTGSPHRLTRGPKRTAGSLLTPPAQKITDESPNSVSGKTGAALDVSTDFNLETVHNCIENLCKKVGDTSISLQREAYIRHALTLQQQLADYQSIEKMSFQAELLAKEKVLQKKVAEDTLSTSLAEILAQLEQD